MERWSLFCSPWIPLGPLGAVTKVTNRMDENDAVLVLHLHLKKILEASDFALSGALSQHVNHLLSL